MKTIIVIFLSLFLFGCNQYTACPSYSDGPNTTGVDNGRSETYSKNKKYDKSIELNKNKNSNFYKK